jgi:hypothetical protein
MMGRPPLFGLLTAAHFVVTVGLLLFVFGAGVSGLIPVVSRDGSKPRAVACSACSGFPC